MKKLVIVESPTKAKTIGRFLGKHFTVSSSMGHLIDLPRSKIGVDVDNNFTPSYIVIKGKSKLLNQLKKQMAASSVVYLATDCDREGEAISWHLRERLKQGGDKEFLRVVFHEITPQAIRKAFANTQPLDLNKVNAQQARRILDRVVGYLLSPLLWKKLAKGLSAGRVQSVALKLIAQRDREIQVFNPEEYWKLIAKLKREQKNSLAFDAELVKHKNKKLEIKNAQQMDNIVLELKNARYFVAAVKKAEKKRNAYPPFITSTLQQSAFSRLHFSARKTMLLAQQLYEGIELGEKGQIGLITYMRTDSVKIAETAVENIRKFIADNYGANYLPDKPIFYKSRASAQQAHEAIRPTSVLNTPEQVKDYLDEGQYKLYVLIWQRTVACQMRSARYLTNNVEVSAKEYSFVARGIVLLFDGFLKV
ncbi:MAG: type I DNA topoisomerase, partial [Candidatus Omnitrophota bacterium]